MKSYSAIAFFSALAAAESMMPAMPQMQDAVMIEVQDGPAVKPAADGGKITEVVVGSINAMGQTTPSFSPNSVKVAPGDTVRFMMMAGNASIVQTSLDAPCSPVKDAAKSEMMSNPNGEMPPPSFDFVVKDEAATFFSSDDMAACMSGQALVINPDMQAGGFAAFVNKAAAVNKELAPAGGIVVQQAPAQTAAGETITVSVAGAAAATGGAQSPATVAEGQGMTGQGQACQCQCLCGVTAFPDDVGVGMFGGFLAEMPTAPQDPQVVGAMSAAAPSAAAMPPPMKRAVMPPMRRQRYF